MAEHNDLGKWGEEKAAAYLRSQGFAIRDRDWRDGRRDLDIVAISQDERLLVIAEVKTRSSADLEEPEQAVDRKKIRNIGIAADTYIRQFAIDCEVRFDIISVVGTDDAHCRIEHIENAFNPLLA